MVDVVSCECLTTIFARLMCYSVISGDTELRVMERLISKRGPGMSGNLAPPTVQIESSSFLSPSDFALSCSVVTVVSLVSCLLAPAER